MKIIIIKTYKNLKINEVIEASDGYAKNFLIKKGYAVSYNPTNKKTLSNNLKKIDIQIAKEISDSNKLKSIIENIILRFTLKVSKQNVIGSISSKNVIKKLLTMDITIPKHSLQHVQITSLGISYAEIKLSQNIKASLKIEVKGEHV